MIDSDFNTLTQEIPNKNEINGNRKDKRKSLVVIMIIIIGQTMSVLNTLINNFTTKTFQYQYPILYYGGFFFVFFIVWMCINRKVKEPKRYYYLIILFESQSFFFDYLANYSYISQNNLMEESIKNKTQNDTNLYIENNTTDVNIDKEFINGYPSYINFPIQFTITFFLFLIFLKKKYSLRKRHYFSLFLGIISVGLFTYFYYYNYFKYSLSLFNTFKISSKIKIIIFSTSSNLLLSLSYILQEHFFKSGQEIYDFFPYKAFLSMIILGFESFCVGEFQFINKEIFKNKDIILNFLYFSLINIIYLSIIPFLIKHITSVMLTTNYINYLFYYYIFYLSKKQFLNNYGLLIVFGPITNLLSFYIFVKYKIKKTYEDLKETIEKTNIGSLLNHPNKYDINKSDNNGSTHVEMNLQISNNPLDNMN